MKHLLRSRLFWLGALELLVGMADLVRTNVLESERAAWGAVITGAMTILLRIVTTKAVRVR
jgi:hypothetical protein